MTIKTGAALLLLLAATVGAHAAGLGRLTVNSALGQPLDAEIELVSVQAGELDTLAARVASPEAYRDARIEYSAALRLLRFSIDKRANGQPYIKLSSIAPINEPFVDVLIEMSWPAGRIQREYPILLDPPGFAARAAAGLAVPPPARVASTPPPAAAPAVSPSTPAPAAVTPSGAPSARAELAASQASSPSPALVSTAGETYGPVQKGETLRKIAGEVKPSNVSMEQMLVALYRENQGAFVDNNMNRLKAGQILKVPSADEATKVEDKEANREIRTHVTNWKAYRDQLAGGVGSIPARAESSSTSSGRIASAAVPPPAPPAGDAKDVLKLSKSDAGRAPSAAGKGGAGGSDRVNALQEEVTAKDKALKESQSRVAELEKQIRDMQRLLDLKGAPVKADDKSRPADKSKPADKAPAKPETKVAEAPKPAEPAKPVEAPKPPEAAKPADLKVAEAPKPVDAPKVADASKPADTKAAPKKSAPPPPPPPSFMEEYQNYIIGGVGALGLLAFAGFMVSRRRKNRGDAGPQSGMTSAFPSDLKPNTSTGKPGGGLVDTGNSSFLTDFDKTGPGTIDTDEVDPVAEAEVYIAYGRDAQAEEILKEAMARDKGRHEIALKLLEIYHARKSATAFETVARELHAAVGDGSPMWTKAAAMGAQIDPTNPLYAAAASGTSTFAAMAPAAPAAKPDLDFDLDSSAATSATETSAPAPDFDLDLDSKKHASDLDLDSPSSSMDMDLDSSPAAVEPARDEKPAFDFDLSGLDFPGKSDTDKTLGPSGGTAPMNLADISLDAPPDTGGGDAVGTKLELAKAYLEIGDKDGAREILEEVVKEGSAAQKGEAQGLIASL